VKNLTNNKVQNWNKDFTLSVRVNRIQSHLESIKPLASAKDLELEELSKLKPFLDSLGIASEHHVQGVYLKLLKSGKGGIAQSGQQLFIHYRGFFINGIEYDNTRKSGQLLDFQLGKPNQVIKAFEIALHQMRAGDKMLVVSPSSLAFGDGGSATGIVPPYSSVIYELELIKIE
jgi:FKBP-type peptidyl-prolyl cis-trans isomerase